MRPDPMLTYWFLLVIALGLAIGGGFALLYLTLRNRK